MPSPTIAMATPAPIVSRVGSASQSTSAPKMNPSVTRLRATASASLARRRASILDTGRFDRETTLDGADHFVYLNVHQAHDVEPAMAQVMALAHAVTRNRDVVGRPRPVARRSCRTVNADNGRADGGGDMRRTGVARHHDGGGARQGNETVHRRRRRHTRRATRCGGNFVRQPFLIGPPEYD